MNDARAGKTLRTNNEMISMNPRSPGGGAAVKQAMKRLHAHLHMSLRLGLGWIFVLYMGFGMWVQDTLGSLQTGRAKTGGRL